ncbi:MAG: PhzF family phenazine biosynthesis protein [Bacteroidetes bacterium]|nr:PhzF family phenazine biosynthesis protein [Bacteroidota bacterium]MCH8524113.1 PhzF family phenazine biosynthesis protein [Balneolales bacterium]
MNTIRIKQVDAFTLKPFTGNPAGVVLDADHLSTEEMQKIANEMNLAETVFVLKPQNPEEADARLRWFTPTQEVDLCGHATIAAFHAMAETGKFDLEVDENQSFLVETRSGILTVDVEWKNMLPYIKFSLPVAEFFPFPDDIAVLCGALGLSQIELSKNAKPQITREGYCFVPVRDADSLMSLDPNMELLKKMYERHEITAFAVVTTDTGEKNMDWHMRFFAPALGVNEDHVTGSAHGPMAVYLLYNGLLDDDKKYFSFTATQGQSTGRPGTITINMTVSDGVADEVLIAGQAVTVMDGTMIMSTQIPGKL